MNWIYTNLPILLVVVPLLVALTIPAIGRLHKDMPWAMATGAIAFSAWSTFALLFQVWEGDVVTYDLGGWGAPTGIVYTVDRLNAFVLVLVGVVGILSVVYMKKSIFKEIPERAHKAFYTVFLLYFTGLLGIVITGDLFNLYVFIEISSITSYALIAMGRSREALYASFAYLVIGSIGATFILLGIGHLYMATGTLDMADMAEKIPALYDSSVIRTAFAYFTVGLGIKMALFPLHGWQPAAYATAPSAISMFMSATGTKAMAYAFYRIAFGIFGATFLTDVLPVIRDGIEVMAASAIVLGPLFAIRQTDIKRTFAYSSMGQIGYIMLAVVILNQDGVTGGILHFWNHGAAKAALFAVAGAVVYLSGSSRIQDMAGMGKTAPWTATALTIAGCSLIGVPLTSGFVSKFYLAVGSISEGRYILTVVLLLSSLLTAVYLWKILQVVWFPPEGTVPVIKEDVPWMMRGPILILAGLCLYLGWATEFPVAVAKGAADVLLR